MVQACKWGNHFDFETQGVRLPNQKRGYGVWASPKKNNIPQKDP